MKAILIIITAILVLSCKKDTPVNNNNEPSYIGVYTSTHFDTVKVTQNGDYLKFVFSNYISEHTPVPPPTIPNPIGSSEQNSIRSFDSIRVVPDLTFTNNEIEDVYSFCTGTIVPLCSPSSYTERAIGIGSFGNNVMQFHIVLDAGGIFDFSGVKL